MDNKFVKLLISLLLPFLAAAAGSVFTFPSIPIWYQGLNKPFFTPPSFLFAPVWTVLYVLMGLSFFLIWSKSVSKNKKVKQEGMRFFLAQLIFNAFWSYTFFGLHSLALSGAVIVVLIILIYVTIKLFARVSKTASYLLYPYLAWVLFATLLNVGILILNS